MRKRTKIIITILGTIGTVLILAVSTVGIAEAMYTRQLNRDVDQLFAQSNARAEPAVVSEADLARLPEPVQRWLRWAQVVGKPVPQTVRLQQDGQFKASENGGWMDFNANQYYTTDPPGFVWTVSMKMMPLVTIQGRDKYAGGMGDIQMKALSLVTVAHERGGGLDQGALLRYLGEIIWFPAGAISPHLAWSPIDATHAQATMTYQGTTASAIFTIDAEGRPVDVSADRYNDAKGQNVPWSGRSYQFGELNGMRVPTAGDGVWHYPTGDYVYITWHITRLETDVAKRF